MELLNIKTSNFEGPFDLLLHLIKKNKMDIYSIEISKIVNQYLSYLDEMRQIDLEITSEFIVIAATLIEIKSKQLLPEIKKSTEVDLEEDTEQNLMKKLIEYEKFKNISTYFKEKHISLGEIFSKKPEIIEEVELKVNYEELLKGLTLLDLYNIFNKVMEDYLEKQNKENLIQKRIFMDKFTIKDKMKYIKDKLTEMNTILFNDIIESCDSKLEIIVNFLALLELVKLKEAFVYQDDKFSKILIKKREDNDEN